MSVIAYDGKTLAADRQGVRGDLRCLSQKLVRVQTYGGLDVIVGWTGDHDRGLALLELIIAGELGAKWPEWQRRDEATVTLIVANLSNKAVLMYGREPVPIPVLDPIMAWGSGRDFALGAMARGASAAEAVEIACRFDTGCGMGVDVFELGA